MADTATKTKAALTKQAKAEAYLSRFDSEKQAAFARLLEARTNAGIELVNRIGNLASPQYVDKDGSFTRDERNATAMRALDAIALEIETVRAKFAGLKDSGPKFTV